MLYLKPPNDTDPDTLLILVLDDVDVTVTPVVPDIDTKLLVDDNNAEPVAPDAVNDIGPDWVLIIAEPVPVVDNDTPVEPVTDIEPDDAVNDDDPVDAVIATPVLPDIDNDDVVDDNNTLPVVAVIDNGPDNVDTLPLPKPVDDIDTPVVPDNDTEPDNAFIVIPPVDDVNDTPVAPFNVIWL